MVDENLRPVVASEGSAAVPKKTKSITPLKFPFFFVKFVLLRALRLLPAEFFCIAVALYVMPYTGTGILWNVIQPGGTGGHCTDGTGAGGCEKW